MVEGRTSCRETRWWLMWLALQAEGRCGWRGRWKGRESPQRVVMTRWGSLCSTLPCPVHSTRIQADPGGSKWNGRNLVGIQVNSNLIPSKNNLIIQTKIFIHSRSFQVIPGGIQVFQVIPGGIQVKKRMIILATFQVHSHHIPGHSR